MVEEKDGWYVVNVQDAKWAKSNDFGWRCLLEKEGEKFTDIGVNLRVIEPGKPACKYHRENAQEDFLVLSGECTLLVNGEERSLKAWDFVHCPPGVSHVFVGAGSGPCAILMIGHRRPDHQLFYPQHELAARHGAETPEPTPEPRVAYAGTHRPEPAPAPRWPLGN